MSTSGVNPTRGTQGAGDGNQLQKQISDILDKMEDTQKIQDNNKQELQKVLTKDKAIAGVFSPAMSALDEAGQNASSIIAAMHVTNSGQ